MALAANEQGLTVVVAISLANFCISTAIHLSGQGLADATEIVIDKCVPFEDEVVSNGWKEVTDIEKERGYGL